MKKIHFISFIVFCLMQLSAAGQITFQKIYSSLNYGFGYAGNQTSDGGYIAAGGGYDSNQIYNYCIIRLAANGDTLWTKSIGSTRTDFGTDIRQTADGEFIACGTATNIFYNHPCPHVIRLNSFGDTLWTRTFGDVGGSIQYNYFSCVVELADGFILSGSLSSQSFGGIDQLFVKIDTNGLIRWSKTFSFGSNCYTAASCIVKTYDNGFVLAGSTECVGAGQTDLTLIKTDSSGNVVWDKTYGGTDQEGASNVGAQAVIQTADSGFAIVGATVSFGAGNVDFYLVKTDQNGDTLWSRTYGTANRDYPHWISQTNDGGYIMSGRITTHLDSTQVYLIRIDSAGNIMWSKMYGRTLYQNYKNTVQQTSDGGFFVTGENLSNDNLVTSLYLIKTDENGNSGCNEKEVTAAMGFPPTQTSSPAIIQTNVLFHIVYDPVGITNVSTVTDICLTQGVSEIQNMQEMCIYPNPTTNHFTINSSIKNGRVEIFNTLGEKVYSEKIKSEPIYLNQPAGIYFVRVSDGETVYSQKLVIE
jgi:hypothetical protein